MENRFNSSATDVATVAQRSCAVTKWQWNVGARARLCDVFSLHFLTKFVCFFTKYVVFITFNAKWVVRLNVWVNFMTDSGVSFPIMYHILLTIGKPCLINHLCIFFMNYNLIYWSNVAKIFKRVSLLFGYENGILYHIGFI